MPRQGLNKEAVLDAAVAVIEESGHRYFSMHSLAEKLNVRTASLYNHIDSMDSLLTDVAYRAISALAEAEQMAICGKEKEEAIFALSMEYYKFAKEHPGLYGIILAVPGTKNEAIKEAVGKIIDPIMKVLSDYGFSEEKKMHLQRVLRGIMHGFISQEQAGFYTRFPVSSQESYREAILCFTEYLKNTEEKVGKDENR